MKKFLVLSLLLAAVMLAANSCATKPAALNVAPADNSGGFTVAPPTPAAVQPTPTPTPNYPTATSAPVSVGINTSSVATPPVPPPAPAPTPTPAPTPAPIPVTPPAAAKVQINIQNFAFNPAQVTVAVGDTVVWTNLDPVPHQIASASFNSAPLSQGNSFSQKFTAAGTYDYHCAIHPSMTGKVIVK